jgi:hypothetical protein
LGAIRSQLIGSIDKRPADGSRILTSPPETERQKIYYRTIPLDFGVVPGYVCPKPLPTLARADAELARIQAELYGAPREA